MPRKRKKDMPLKAVAGAIRSVLTPTRLKRGLLKKYGRALKRRGYI